jgi:signal-transduction protein with cAMP-binding, CBS, and nucleotidyltransferase domain
MDDSLLNFLSSNQIFNQLTIQEIKSLGQLISQEKVPASSYIFLEDEEAYHFYILREGILRAMIGGKLLASIKPGGLFGEIAVLNNSFRTGSVFADEDSLIIKIDGKKLFEGNSIPVEISYKILKELIKPLISLHYTNDFYRRTKDIIRLGESGKIEFKSTLRYNIHTAKFGREIEHAALKSIAAFLNSWGGILLVGVDDSKNITGMEADQFENDDKAMLHLTNMIKERMGAHFMQFIVCSVEPIESRKVMRIDVSPSNLPAFLNNNNEEFFYVRTGPSTTELKPSRIYDYIDNRFYRPHA